jgi:hypothetical protein
MAQLRDMDVAAWTASANEWHTASEQLIAAARDVHDQVLRELPDAWTGQASTQAQSVVQDLVNRLEVDSMECQAVAFLVHGLAHTFQIAQSSLRTALAAAAQGGFRVTDSGTVELPNSPMARHDPDYAEWCRTQRGRLATLIDNAIDVASRADRAAHEELDTLSRHTDLTDPDRVKDGDLSDTSRIEVDLIAGTVPHGDRTVVAAWWASLSDTDRQTLLQVAPWALENLDGIPEDVRNGIRGTNYDGARVARWAIDHWQDNSDDPFDDNCTNFASNALEGGGVKQYDAFWGTLDDDSWDKGHQWGIGPLDEKDYSHSPSWAQAPASYQFWSEHGTEVTMADARPGDIIYWEQADDGHDIPAGTVHHAAIVTSVVDGDIRYTQHSGNQLAASYDGRAPVNEITGGQQRVHIIRPNPSW